MKLPIRIFCSLLAVYSFLLLWIEWRTSQDHVRHYFSDIEGEVLFHAVNTSLSASLLAGAALLLAFAALARPGEAKAARPFLLTQAAMFGLFAFDDRFQLHERLGYRLGVPDHYVMLLWAVAELGLLGLYCRPEHVTRRMVAFFLTGTGWFAVMLFIDAFAPHDLFLRLSAEDLAKAWGAAMFFWFGWEAARFHLLGEGIAVPSRSQGDPAGSTAPSMSPSR